MTEGQSMVFSAWRNRYLPLNPTKIIPSRNHSILANFEFSVRFSTGQIGTYDP